MPLKTVHTFWFISVAEFLLLPDLDCPRHQELRARGVLYSREIHLREIVSGTLKGAFAAVSHRWAEPSHFDPNGVKMRRLKDFLKKHPSIKFLWIDWLCMPQVHRGGRSESDTAYFKETLGVILPGLFLGVTVIILFERQYNTRFWPLVETFVAMQTATANGLVPTSREQDRVLVAGLFDSEGDEEIDYVALKAKNEITTEMAIAKLRSETVFVTNQSDKDINLTVLETLDADLKALGSAHDEHTGVVVWKALQREGWFHVFLRDEDGFVVDRLPNETLVQVLTSSSQDVLVQAGSQKGWANRWNFEKIEDDLPRALRSATAQSKERNDELSSICVIS